MKVAVIGSGGFIGRYLVGALAQDNQTVVPLSSKDGSGIDPETGLISGNVRLDGVEAIVYLAQSPLARKVPDMSGRLLRVNVISAVEAAELARRAGVRRFVYTSTGNVYRPAFHPLAEGDPAEGRDWYTLSKLHGEQALNLYREYMDVHVLRLFGVYGPGQSGRLMPALVRAIKSGRPVYVERNPLDAQDLDGLRISLGYAEDVVNTIVRICEIGGPELMNVAGDEVLSVRGAAEAIGQILGVSPVIDVADRFRAGNLIADVTRHREFHPNSPTPFSVGLWRTLGHGGAD